MLSTQRISSVPSPKGERSLSMRAREEDIYQRFRCTRGPSLGNASDSPSSAPDSGIWTRGLRVYNIHTMYNTRRYDVLIQLRHRLQSHSPAFQPGILQEPVSHRSFYYTESGLFASRFPHSYKKKIHPAFTLALENPSPIYVFGYSLLYISVHAPSSCTKLSSNLQTPPSP